MLKELIYELSLATARPFPKQSNHLTRSAAAVEALKAFLKDLHPSELKQMQYGVYPLLFLLGQATKTTFDSVEPCSITAAGCLCMLLPSRSCMAQVIEVGGLKVIHEILYDLLSSKDLNLADDSALVTVLVESCAVLLRELALFYPSEIVEMGALLFVVKMLRLGSVALKTVAASTLAALSSNLATCKQLFSYGAIKPLLDVADPIVTNEACMLSAIGCIVQLCRIPEITIMVVKQGAMPVLVRALTMHGTYANDSIHEKAILGLSCISQVPQLRPVLAKDEILHRFRIELERGTEKAKYTVVHILLHIHGVYPKEEEYLLINYPSIVALFQTGNWTAKTACIKAFAVLYRRNMDLLLDFVVNGGALEGLLNAVQTRHEDLQEVVLVGLLTLCTHADIPWLFIDKGGVPIVSELLFCADEITKDLTVVLLKGIALYNRPLVESTVDEQFQYLFASFLSETYEEDQHKYTSGNMIDEFLHEMVENRRDQHYLQETFPDFKERILALNVSPEELSSYEHIFYELDSECRGMLGLLELKILAVMLGEQFDEEELEELLSKNDTDNSGSLDFMEFIVMMQNWFSENAQSNVVEQAAHDAIQRGPVAKAKRAFLRWWNRDAIARKEIDDMKARKEQQRVEARRLAEEFLTDKNIAGGRSKRTDAVNRREKTVSGSNQLVGGGRESIRDLSKKKKGIT